MSMLPAAWVEAALAACREAGRAACAARAGSECTTTRKPDGSPVSAADEAASRVVGERLRALDPSVPVICEEGLQHAAGAARFWLVDPLDGTREFLRGGTAWTVNIALIENALPVFGAVHAPDLGVLYHGIRGSGAWRDGLPISARRASARLRVLVSPGEHARLPQAFLDALSRVFPQARVDALPGALKFCRLAEGEADLYPRWSPSCAWDSAAGQAILEAAGGAVLTLDGTQLGYRETPGWLNPHFVALADPGLDRAGLGFG